MKDDPSIELLCRLNPKCDAAISDLRLDLRATEIELRAYADNLRIDHGINVLFKTDPHNTGKITHATISMKTWARAQRICDEYLRVRELVGEA